ncbi:glycosyl hydrolase family 61-domain-containing protein [Ephemerocybe angulata]|uniref:AA9 family lytic polysaccharide monooxygenase n=1 Tax=Ephemerocybe angulata TaxID=980116 RepID=A0A8H6M3L4_9AGAR|nr:glycosyl hydrolase family 61-domain-containing protein [Tulosesus angulatus]
MIAHTLVTTLALAVVASAHMSIFGVWINGQFQGDGRNLYERTKFNIQTNSPVRNVDWSYIACHTLGSREQPKWLEVKAGDTFAPEWYWNERGDFYTGSHVGPVLVYIAPAVSTGPNTPEIWTKLFHYAYNAIDGKWADDYFKEDATATKGHHFITIPDIPAGNYLIRSEVIALQEAKFPNGAQHFPSCVQVRVMTNGTTSLPGGVSFPGTYLPNQPGIRWPPEGAETADPKDYPLPGGEVWGKSPGGGIYGLNV